MWSLSNPLATSSPFLYLAYLLGANGALFRNSEQEAKNYANVKLLFAFVNVKRIYLKEQQEQCSEETNGRLEVAPLLFINKHM